MILKERGRGDVEGKGRGMLKGRGRLLKGMEVLMGRGMEKEW